MLTRIDHVMMCVPDLQRGIDAYTRIGFNIHPGGVHPGRGTHNAIAFLQDKSASWGRSSNRDRLPGTGIEWLRAPILKSSNHRQEVSACSLTARRRLANSTPD